jgi:hypothetical protein
MCSIAQIGVDDSHSKVLWRVQHFRCNEALACVVLDVIDGQERIELRNLRRVDMDRYQSGLSSKSKKDKVSDT